MLPPQAGHDSCIVDFSAEQSQMRTILASGLERAYALDWIGATRETADATIEDYLDVIDRAVAHELELACFKQAPAPGASDECAHVLERMLLDLRE